jgi:choline kinase
VSSLQAVILAAGCGTRLAQDAHSGTVPKPLLRFGSQSLLERHLHLLRECGVSDVWVAVGYAADQVRAELARLQDAPPADTVFNPDYRLGSIVTVWHAREPLLMGRDTLLMDADVLYDERMLRALVDSRQSDCLLLDRDFEPGEEPVKVCVRDGRIVEFRKQVAPDLAFDVCGESVGFFRLSGQTCRALVARASAYLETGRGDEPHEEALRDLMLEAGPRRFGIEDITGLPWIEIDFPGDIERARLEILPQLQR